jgi:CBS domain-containing protein
MKVQDNILNDIQPLQVEAGISEILDIMEELKYGHLPVVNPERHYLGLVCEDDLLEADGSDDRLSQHLRFLHPYAIDAEANLFEALRVVGQGNLSLLPVVNKAGEYQGYLSPLELIQDMGRQLTFTESGSVLVLEIPTRDYQLSQISQIIESEDARIIGFHLTAAEAPDNLNLSLKINQPDLSRILQSLERYNYKVLMVFHESMIDDGMADRYASFMNYLNI